MHARRYRGVPQGESNISTPSYHSTRGRQEVGNGGMVGNVDNGTLLAVGILIAFYLFASGAIDY